MNKCRFTDEQIIGFLKQAEAGLPDAQLLEQIALYRTSCSGRCWD